MQQVDDPPFLSVGTEVSAKYKGAFCEAKVRKVVRNIKCKVAYKQGLGSGTVSDDLIKGALRVGASVEVKHPDKREYVEATITKIQDCSQYTVVFDDGDITTLRRTALCLKSGRHFNESETLDQLPLTHPEHFGNPVIGGRRGRRSRHLQDDSSDDDDDQDSKEVVNEKEEHIGKVICVESTETKKKDKDKWFPGLVVSPTAQVTVRIRVKDEYLVRSFKDGRYYTVPKKEAMEFTRELAAKQEGPAVQAALEYLDNDTLPTHWDRDALFGLANSSSECDEEYDSDSSNDEPREEKDHFVAQLYKYMDDRGTPLNKVPSITNKDVDLYRLFRAVQKLGGYNRVTGQNQWKQITQRLGFNPATVSVTNLVKQAYKKFLQPFEEFDRKLGCSMSMTPRTNRSKGRSLVRANSVASPKPELKEPKVVSAAEESENTSESSMDATKMKRKLSTGSGKVKALVEKFEEKNKEESEPPPKISKASAAAAAAVVVAAAAAAATTTTATVTSKTEEQQVIPVASTSTTPSGPAKKEKPTKKQTPVLEDKRGRKRKDGGDVEKIAEKPSEPAAVPEFPVEVGDKLKVYYHEKKVTYEAKVIEISMQQGTPLYLVHYTGWNTRYDEWVPRERIAENLTTSKTKRTKGGASGNQKANAIPPNDGNAKASEKNALLTSCLPSTTPKPIGASKRGRGRSDSQPPRSTTPSSLASGSSRTKSPAATTTQRRTTRAQPSISRRTSNNISDMSAHTDSDTDSDEPVRKPTRSSSASALASQAAAAKSAAQKSAPPVATANSQSETEEEEPNPSPLVAKGRDYDLNQIRSELKGFKELKSPSPEPELTPSQVADGKKPGNAFDFNITDESEGKPTASVISKSSLSVTESKSSTDISSETDSFADDDSQSSDKTTTLENMTEKLQQKIKAEKLAQAKCLERMGGAKGAEKIAPIKSSSIEKIIKETLAEKMQETMKAKPFALEKSLFKAVEKEDKPKIVAEIKPPPLPKVSPAERKAMQAAAQAEKKPPTLQEIRPPPARLDRKTAAAMEKLAVSPAKASTSSKESQPLEVQSTKSESGSEKIPRETAPPPAPTPPQSTGAATKSATAQAKLSADIYEFKEPEPFEFESRKVTAGVTTSPDIDKKPNKKAAQKSLPSEPEVTKPAQVSAPTPPATAKKTKKSPTKDPEKSKQMRIEEKAQPMAMEQSPPVLLVPPIKPESTLFDALRKSPSFNLNISGSAEAMDESMSQEVVAITKPAPLLPPALEIEPERASTPPPNPQKILPFSSPFMETIKPETSKVFDLKADCENFQGGSDDDKKYSNKYELETVKKILLSDSSFDLEPPKIEKPSSIADKVLKALHQQKQEGLKPKEEEPEPPAPPAVVEAPQIPAFPIAEPPKIELPAVIKKEIEMPLKKPILSSPEHKLDILESIAPKNNDLSETIQKLESAIQKTSNVDHFEDDSSDSTDSERRLVIEDDSQSSEPNQPETQTEFPVIIVAPARKPDPPKEEPVVKPEPPPPVPPPTAVKDEPYIFAPKFTTSIFGLHAASYSDAALLSDVGVKPIVDIIPSFKIDKEPPPKLTLVIHPEVNEASTSTANNQPLTLKKEDLLCQENQSIHSESINLLLCEETIPGSPTPARDCSEIKPNLHPIESDIKPIPMDIECGAISTTADIPGGKHTKSEDRTPNSSPRESMSQDDSSEDLKKQELEQDIDVSPKKRRRTRKHSEGENLSTLSKRRRANMSVVRKNNGSDSEDNSDATLSQRSTSSRPSRPCQYNFLVQLDPAMNPNQRIAILRKKIQELRKTYNSIKAELASIDRRRKKLRRREREKKNQQKLTS